MTQSAVLTGDFIASSKVGPSLLDNAMGLIEATVEQQARLADGEIRFERFRGDGWQVFLADMTQVFRITLLILAELGRRPELPGTRIAIGIGPVDQIPPKGLAGAHGDAFELSGRALDAMNSTVRMYLTTKGKEGRWLRPLFAYLDWQSSRWSQEQAEALGLAFMTDPPRAHAVAEHLGITRQAAQARLKGAGYSPLKEAVTAFRLQKGSDE